MNEPTGRPDPVPPAPSGPAAPAPRSDRTRIRRHADRAEPDRIEEFLRSGLVAHVACVEDGEPRLIPFLYHYETGHIYLHGSPGNATLRLLRDGRQVVVAVTRLDDMVASKTAPDHSANYRSVVAYGRGREIEDLAEKRHVLDAMTERYFPGRRPSHDYAPATDDDLARMELTDVAVEEASAKMREGGPMGPHDAEPDFPGSAFVRPV
jgi:nitroimidazol reductase NimA-like FMN-containing flavoprotein (pyridoxamine 5'-phosphate oxidase superfamily)